MSDPDPTCALASQLDEYERFHRAHRHSANAQYLVYTCRALMPMASATGGTLPRARAQPCLGIGDRFRLICFMLRVAIAFKRVLLVDWQSPHPIETFFSPNRIDWRVRPDELAALDREPVLKWSSSMESEPPRTRFLRIVGNAQWHADVRLTADGPLQAYEPRLSCLFHFVFRPSPWLSDTMAARRLAMFGSATRPFIALHVRMGDAADGVAFSHTTVPQTDRRYTHASALHMIKCVSSAVVPPQCPSQSFTAFLRPSMAFH